MLIPSHRHTSADLSMWHEHEAADLVTSRSCRDKEKSAIDCVLEFSSNRATYAGVSWGKDSVVVAHLLWRTARHVPLIHLRPTNHNPDCDAVRDAYFTSFPGQPYREILVDYRDIDRVKLTRVDLDHATDRQWYAAIRSLDRDFTGHILGIRAGESRGRLIRMLKWGVASPNALAPIGFWSTAEVFSYLARHDLPVHPAYAMLGGGRWPRERLRVAEIGDTHGTGGGRAEWEQEYYGDVLNRLTAKHAIWEAGRMRN